MAPGRHGDAVSPVLGVVLMVAVTVLLAAIILALLSWLPHLCDPFPPAVIRVVEVHDYDENGIELNYDSRLLMRNYGTKDIPNRQITAAFYCDGVRVNCRLVNFHGEDDVPSHHYGIQRVGGLGCRDETWESGGSVLIDFTDRTFMPGKKVRVDIIDIRSGCVISRDYFDHSAVPSR